MVTFGVALHHGTDCSATLGGWGRTGTAWHFHFHPGTHIQVGNSPKP